MYVSYVHLLVSQMDSLIHVVLLHAQALGWMTYAGGNWRWVGGGIKEEAMIAFILPIHDNSFCSLNIQ